MRLTPRARPTDRNELCSQLIMNAAFVAYETQKAKALKQLLDKDENRRVIYVFDTDLITTWYAPWRSGPIDPITLGQGYGQILPQRIVSDLEPHRIAGFPDEERAQAEAIAWLLASRALDEAFSAGAPLLLTETHFAETMKVYQSVKHVAAAYDDVSKKRVDARLDFQLSSTLRAVKSNLNSDATWAINAQNAGAIIGGILRIIDSRNATRTHGAVRQWDSFNDIIRIGNGLFKLTEYRPVNQSFGRDSAGKWEALCHAIAKGEGTAEIAALIQRPCQAQTRLFESRRLRRAL